MDYTTLSTVLHVLGAILIFASAYLFAMGFRVDDKLRVVRSHWAGLAGSITLVVANILSQDTVFAVIFGGLAIYYAICFFKESFIQ